MTIDTLDYLTEHSSDDKKLRDTLTEAEDALKSNFLLFVFDIVPSEIGIVQTAFWRVKSYHRKKQISNDMKGYTL